MKKNLLKLFSLTAAFIISGLQLKAQCPTGAYVSTGGDCVSISWSGTAVPNPLPTSLIYNNITYTLSSGLGDPAFPAVYKSTTNTCQLPSTYANGNITLNYTGSSVTCAYGTVLAISDINLIATSQSGKTVIEWWSKIKSVGEFDIQRSDNAKDFTTIAKVDPNHHLEETQAYTYTDNNGAAAYYRLKVIEATKTWFTKIVHTDNSTEPLNIQPNPSTGSFTIRGLSDATRFSVNIFDAAGKKLPFAIVSKAKDQISLRLMNKATGMVFISCSDGSEKINTKALIQ